MTSSSFNSFGSLSQRFGALWRASGLALAAAFTALTSQAQVEIDLAAHYMGPGMLGPFSWHADASHDEFDVIVLTPSVQDAEGYIITQDAVEMAQDRSFSAYFVCSIGENIGVGADGVSFFLTLVQTPVFKNGQLLAVHLDTYHNSEEGETSHNSISIDTPWENGVAGTDRYVDLPFQLDSDQGMKTWFVWIDYDGVTGIIEVRINSEADRPLDPILSAYVPEVSTMGQYLYPGVYASTGLYASRHELGAFMFNAAYTPLDPANEDYVSPNTGFPAKIVAYNGPTSVEQGSGIPLSIDDFEIVDPDTEPEELWLDILSGEGYDRDGTALYFDGGAYGPTMVAVRVWDGISFGEPFFIEFDVSGDNLPPTFNPQTIRLAPEVPYFLKLEDSGIIDLDSSLDEYSIYADTGEHYQFDWQNGAVIASEQSPDSFMIEATVWYHGNNYFYRNIQIPAVLDRHAPTIGKDIFYIQYPDSLTLTPELLQVADPDTDPSVYSVEVRPGYYYLIDSEGAIVPDVDFGVMFVDLVLRDTETGAEYPFEIRVGVGEQNTAPVILDQLEPLYMYEDDSLYVSHEDVLVQDEHYPHLHTIILHPGENYSVNNGVISPAPDFNGVLSVPISVHDGEFESEPSIYTVVVYEVDDPPVIDPKPVWLQHDVPKQITLEEIGFYDIDNDLSDYYLEVDESPYFDRHDLVTVELNQDAPPTFVFNINIYSYVDQSYFETVELLAKVGYPPTIGVSSISLPPDYTTYLYPDLFKVEDPDTETWVYDVVPLEGEGYLIGNYNSVTPLPGYDFFTLKFHLQDYYTGDTFEFSVLVEVRTPEPIIQLSETSVTHRARGPFAMPFVNATSSGDPATSLVVEIDPDSYRPGEDVLVLQHADLAMEGGFNAEAGVYQAYFYGDTKAEDVLSKIAYLSNSIERESRELKLRVWASAEGFDGPASTVTIFVEPAEYHALSFDGNSVATAPNVFIYPAFGATFEAWLRPGPFPQAAGDVFDFLTPNGINLTVRLGEDGSLSFLISDELVTVSSPAVLKEGEWTHIAVLMDPDSEGLHLIRNGVLIHSAMIDYGQFDGWGAIVGATRIGGSDNTGFVGDLDELRVWYGARDVATIAASFRSPITVDDPDFWDLDVYYRFDEGEGILCNSVTDTEWGSLYLGTMYMQEPDPELAPQWFHLSPVIDGPPVRQVVMDEDNSPRRYRPVSFSEGLSPIPPGPRDWNVISNPSHGVAFLELLQNGEGVLLFEPYENENGLELITLVLSAEGSAPASVITQITINPRNDPPVNLVEPSFSSDTQGASMMLTADPGVWEDSLDLSPGEISYRYIWQMADNDLGFNAVPAGEGPTITVEGRDIFRFFSLTVIATDNGEGLPLSRSAQRSTAFIQANAPPTSYEEWALVMMPEATEAERHPDFDYDGDGLPNSHEKYMGLDPASSDANIFQVQPEVVDGQAVFAFYFTVLKDEYVAFSLSHSNDMIQWQQLDTIELVEEADNTARLRATVPLINKPHFFRLSFFLILE